MNAVAATLALLPAVTFGYAYVLYPAVLRALTIFRRTKLPLPDPIEWPFVTITVPAFNAEGVIGAVLENLLAADYPVDRREIIVISDASTDGTHDVVRRFAPFGVELLIMPRRRGKTAAENAAGRIARGSIIVNMDATVRILPHSLKALVRSFEDPHVGVASGCDRSVSVDRDINGAEASYVGYEMWLRDLETRLGGIVGASGCFYGFRRNVHDVNLPEELSRDFASALIAREHGYRSVSVVDATCIVPRARSLDAEYERKIRTMARGLETLWYKRHLLNPMRYGAFAFMLFSHKLCRWLVSLLIPAAIVGLLVLGMSSVAGAVLLGLATGAVVIGAVGLRWSGESAAPRLIALFGYALASNVAGVLAWIRALRGRSTPVWEPTRRPV